MDAEEARPPALVKLNGRREGRPVGPRQGRRGGGRCRGRARAGRAGAAFARCAGRGPPAGTWPQPPECVLDLGTATRGHGRRGVGPGGSDGERASRHPRLAAHCAARPCTRPRRVRRSGLGKAGSTRDPVRSRGPPGPVRVEALRVGFYGGTGARRVWTGVVRGGRQPAARTVPSAIPGAGGLALRAWWSPPGIGAVCWTRPDGRRGTTCSASTRDGPRGWFRSRSVARTPADAFWSWPGP